MTIEKGRCQASRRCTLVDANLSLAGRQELKVAQLPLRSVVLDYLVRI